MNRDRQFLLLLVAVFVILAALLVAPFLEYVFAAGVLAYLLAPVHRRLAPRIGTRVSAVVIMVATLLAVVVPLLALLQSVVQEAQLVVDDVRAFVAETTYVEDLLGRDVTIGDLLGSSSGEGSAIVGGFLDVLGGVTDAGVGIVIMLFVLYYLLTAGPSLLRWTRAAAPLPEDVLDDLLHRVDRLMWAVVVVNALVAVVQGVLTGLGLWFVGFSNVVFWTSLTTALSLIPFVGPPVVWGPAAVYLVLVDRPIGAAVLAVWGTVVVGLSDNYLRPVIGGREAGLNPGLFVVGIFGGVAAFGAMGVFVGPVVLGILKALVEVYVHGESTS